MSHHNIRGLPGDPPRFSDVLVTELIANWADAWRGSWFACVAELSPLTGCEPNSLIEISSEYMEEIVHDVGVGGTTTPADAAFILPFQFPFLLPSGFD